VGLVLDRWKAFGQEEEGWKEGKGKEKEEVRFRSSYLFPNIGVNNHNNP